MSTYGGSKYVIGRRFYSCSRCSGPIQKGERHLAYKPGLYTTRHVCIACSLMRCTQSDRLLFRCAAVEAELRAQS